MAGPSRLPPLGAMDALPAATPPILPPLIRLRAQLVALDALRLPPYAGSAWRGLLGHGLRQAACVTRAPTCDGCLLVSHCVYPRLFEPPALPGTDGRRYAAPPRPYVLDLDPQAPRDYAPAAPLVLGVTLLGEASRQVPYLIQALHLAGQRGLSRAQARFALERLDQETAPGSGDWRPVYATASHRYTPLPAAVGVIPPAPPRARLHLITPLRLKRQGHLVGPQQFSPRDLVGNLLGRLRLLAEHHGGDAGALAGAGLATAAETLTLDPGRLRWHEWTRYSSRQDTLMELGGLVGEADLAGPGLEALWPLLWQGQWVHAGKGTTFGLGAYRLADAVGAP